MIEQITIIQQLVRDYMIIVIYAKNLIPKSSKCSPRLCYLLVIK
jgi:hypothetical protein